MQLGLVGEKYFAYTDLCPGHVRGLCFFSFFQYKLFSSKVIQDTVVAVRVSTNYRNQDKAIHFMNPGKPFNDCLKA